MIKIKNYLKNNKLFILTMLIGIIIYTIQLKYVVLYADDMTLGVEARNSLISNIKYLIFNYMNWGGGPTPLIAIIFMKFNLVIWKLFNCIVMSAIILISVKIINHMSKVNKCIIAVLLWSFIFILNIWVSRETLYWLDGNLAYVLTFFQFLLYFYYIYSILFMNRAIKKYDNILLPIIAFSSGWTGPQIAVLTVCVSVIMFFIKKLVKKEKVPALIIVSMAFSVFGALVEILAPGNSIRMNDGFAEFANYNIIQKVLHRVDSVYSSFFSIQTDEIGFLNLFSYLAFGLVSYIAYIISKNEKNIKIRRIMNIFSMTGILFIVVILVIKNQLINISNNNRLIFENLLVVYNTGSISKMLIFQYVFMTFIIVINLIMIWYICKKKNNYILLCTYLMAIIAQGVMVLSPYSPLRSTIFSIFLLWLSIAYLLQLAFEHRININVILIIVLGIINKNASILALIIYLVYNNFIFKEKKYISVFCTLLIFIALGSTNWLTVTKNYRINKEIYYKNISIISDFVKNNDNSKELKLLRPYDEKYGFSSFVGIEWIEEAVKKYFNIRNDVDLIN